MPLFAQQQPTPEDAARIRAELRELRAERESAAAQSEALAVQAISELPSLPGGPARAVSRYAWLLLDHRMNQLHAIVTCEPLDTSATIRRVPLVLTGQTWLSLEPGRWRIRILPGNPAGPSYFPQVTLSADFQRNHAYALVFDKTVESRWFREFRDQQAIQQKKKASSSNKKNSF